MYVHIYEERKWLPWRCFHRLKRTKKFFVHPSKTSAPFNSIYERLFLIKLICYLWRQWYFVSFVSLIRDVVLINEFLLFFSFNFLFIVFYFILLCFIFFFYDYIPYQNREYDFIGELNSSSFNFTLIESISIRINKISDGFLFD